MLGKVKFIILIDNMKIQMKNNSGNGFVMLKALFSIKRFAESNKKISAYTKEA